MQRIRGLLQESAVRLRGGFRHVPPQKGGPHRPENVGTWTAVQNVGASVAWRLRHLKVYLVQHDILLPGVSVCHIAMSEIYDVAYLFSIYFC